MTHSAAQVLQPAIELAEDGFAIGPVTAHQWAGCVRQLTGVGADALKVPPPPPNPCTLGEEAAATVRNARTAGCRLHRCLHAGTGRRGAQGWAADA